MGVKKHINSIKMSLIIISIVLVCIPFFGCSAHIAFTQPGKKDLSVLKKGTHRSLLISELGDPKHSGQIADEPYDIFQFVQGYSKSNKAVRGIFHIAADVASLGLWEIVGTPLEKTYNGKKMSIQVIYDRNDQVVTVVGPDEDFIPHASLSSKGSDTQIKGSRRNPYYDYNEAVNNIAREISIKAKELLLDPAEITIVIGKTDSTPAHITHAFSTSLIRHGLDQVIPDELISVAIKAGDQFELSIYEEHHRERFNTANTLLVLNMRKIDRRTNLLSASLWALKSIQGKSGRINAGRSLLYCTSEGYVSSL